MGWKRGQRPKILLYQGAKGCSSPVLKMPPPEAGRAAPTPLQGAHVSGLGSDFTTACQPGHVAF